MNGSKRAQSTPVVVDPFSITASQNFGARGCQGTLSILPREQEDDALAWRGDIYAYATPLNPGASFSQLVDFGIGSVREVVRLSWGWPDTVVLVRMRDDSSKETKKLCRSRGFHYVTANLSDPVALAVLEKQLSAVAGPHLMLLSGVLEHLSDPRPLLRMLRRLLKRHPESRLVISTPDRERISGREPSLWPRCPNYQRLWSSTEFCSLLAGAGFKLLYTGYSNENRNGTIICDVQCSKEYYDRFLESNGLPPSSSRMVLISRDSDNPSTGNIEQYIRELKHLPTLQPIVLSIGGRFNASANGLMQEDASSNRWLRAEALSNWDSAWDRAPEAALEAVHHAVFLYDELQLLEYQDYGGVFFRVSQAKRAGLLPPNVVCMVVCHGSNFYQERVNRELQGPQRNLIHLWEKIAIELADVVLYPTKYIRWLYEDQLKLQPLGSILIHRLPYAYTSLSPSHKEIDQIDTIVFLGQQASKNEWHEFCDAIQQFFSEPEYGGLASTVCRIQLMGSTTAGRAITVPDQVKVEEYDLLTDNVVELLRKSSLRSLVILPRYCSNHPYSLFQAVDANCQILMAKAGGAEELIPSPFHDLVCYSPRPRDLVYALQRALSMPLLARANLIYGLKAAMQREQEDINASLSRLYPDKPLPVLGALVEGESPVTIVVPIYNRPFSEIEALIVGVNNQTLLPREVIFIDDASTVDFFSDYADRISSMLQVPARFVRHLRNRGLSGARNTGLMATETEFVAVHDSDNIALNDFLYRGCVALMANPQIDAVTFLIAPFFDGEDWTIHNKMRFYFYPIGDGLVASLGHVNYLGDAMGVYRVSTLRQLGGWDETDSAMWEDLALFLKMLGSNCRLMNVPKIELMYRLRPDSMLRLGSEYDARQGLARATHCLSMFEALCLQRVILAPTSSPPISSLQLGTRGHLIAAVRHYLADKPELKACARWILQTVRGVRALSGRIHHMYARQ